MKKIISLALSVLLLIVMIPFTASANADYVEFEFNIYDDTATLEKYNGYESENVVIPSTYQNYPVTRIESKAFNRNTTIKSVEIPDSVTDIGYQAFSYCTNLESVKFPENLETVNGYAFYECKKLKNITLPKYVLEIGDRAFGYYCDQKSGDEFTINLTVNGYTNSVAEMYARDNGFTFVSVGVAPLYLYEVEETYGDEQPRARITKYLGSQKNVVIPSEIDGYLIVSIDRYAFSKNNYIENVTIPSSIYSIYTEAFAYCSMLKTVTIKSDWISIGDKAFYNCEQLADFIYEPDYPYFDPANDHISIDIREKAIEGTAYYNNKNNFKNGALYLGSALVKVESSVKSFTIPDYVTCIGDDAFKDCTKLTSITIPEKVANIGNGAFEGCTSLNNVIFNKESHCYIEDFAFLNCPSLKEIRVPKNVYLSMYSAGYSYEYVESLGSWTYVTQDGFKVYGETGGEGNAKWFANRSDFEFIECDFSSHTHSYTNSCDTSCNTCGEKRTIKHKYSNKCDAECNICKSTRKITHTYVTTTTKATISKNGKIVKKCTVCGDIASDKAIYYPKTIKLSSTSYTYNGSAKKPTVTVKGYNGKTISSNNYTVTYKNNKNVGTATATVTFKGNYIGTKKLTFKINPASTSKATYKLSTSSYTYNGKTKTPNVTVKLSGKTLKKNTDYTVKYSNNKAVGKATAKITFKGNYKGTKTLTFKINPVKTAVKSLTAGKKSLKVAITKKTTQVTGYQIQYATNKSFKSAKTKYVTSYKTTSATLKGLSAKKTYYVRVRTYKTVKDVKYYSSWSTIKYKKTK